MSAASSQEDVVGMAKIVPLSRIPRRFTNMIARIEDGGDLDPPSSIMARERRGDRAMPAATLTATVST